jgi:N utilization substance protein B
MPVLNRHKDDGTYFILSFHRGEFVTYRLSPEGERHLREELKLPVGGDFDRDVLEFLVEKRWAFRDSSEPGSEDSESEKSRATASETLGKPAGGVPPPPTAEVAVSAPVPAAIPRRLRPTLTRRTRGREVALQVLYQLEQNPGVAPTEVERFIERRLLGDRKLVEFTHALIAGVQGHKPEIDGLISRVAENWRLDRMAAIDRNILRLGAFEMVYCPDVPTKVAINEALELAKRYSTAQSSRFVNGILDRLQNIEPKPAPTTPEPPPAEGKEE